MTPSYQDPEEEAKLQRWLAEQSAPSGIDNANADPVQQDDALKALAQIDVRSAPEPATLSDVQPNAWQRQTDPIATPDERPELPDQAPPPRAVQPPDPMAQFAQAHAPKAASAPVAAAPRAAESHDQFSKLDLGLAALAEMVLNKGRGLGQLIALGGMHKDNGWENQQRQMQLDKNAAEVQHLKTAGTSDPQALWLRQQALDLHRQGLEQSLAQGGRRMDQADRAEATRSQLAQLKIDSADVNSDASRRAREIAKARGIADADGKSADDLARLNPTVNFYAQRTGEVGAADVKHSAQRAGAEAAATEGSRIRVAAVGAQTHANIEATAEEEKRRRAAQEPPKAPRGIQTMLGVIGSAEGAATLAGEQAQQLLDQRPGGEGLSGTIASAADFGQENKARKAKFNNGIRAYATDVTKARNPGHSPSDQEIEGQIKSWGISYEDPYAAEKLRQVRADNAPLFEAARQGMYESFGGTVPTPKGKHRDVRKPPPRPAPAPAPTPAPSGSTVRIQTQDGRHYQVPSANSAAFLAHYPGSQVVE